jgi:hypothetical protein
MATQLAQSDLDGARSLLAQLDQIQPARPEAKEGLRALADATPGTR